MTKDGEEKGVITAITLNRAEDAAEEGRPSKCRIPMVTFSCHRHWWVAPCNNVQFSRRFPCRCGCECALSYEQMCQEFIFVLRSEGNIKKKVKELPQISLRFTASCPESHCKSTTHFHKLTYPKPRTHGIFLTSLSPQTTNLNWLAAKPDFWLPSTVWP